MNELRGALRSLLRNPGFTTAAVLTLGIGIGATSAVYSVINAVLLQPLPYERPDELVQVMESIEPLGLERWSVSPGEFLTWRERGVGFERLAAIDPRSANLTGGGEPEAIPIVRLSPDYFALLGLRPERGRVFAADEEEPGKDVVAILSHGLWTRRFGADPAVVGTTLRLDGRPHTIVGILAAGAALPQECELAVPLAFTPDQRADRGHHFLDVVGRLRRGESVETAGAAMKTLAAAIWADRPAGSHAHSVRVVRLQEARVGRARPALAALLGAVGLVLLIACANVAGLMVSRAAARERDLAVRAALGAGRARLMAFRIAEGIVIAVLGGGLGLLLALWGVDLLPRLVPGGLPGGLRIGVDGAVLAFCAAVVIATGLLVGLAPALHDRRADVLATLQGGAHGLTAGAGRQRLRGFLVGAEIALTVVLLIGAALLMRSFMSLRGLDPGFAPGGRVVADLALPQAAYPDAARRVAFHDSLLERVGALPGVEAAGMVNVLPLSGSNTSSNYTIEGETSDEARQRTHANRRSVSPGYFRAAGIRLLRGRPFTPRDAAAATPVLIVNESMARRRFAGDAIGRRLRLGSGDANTNPWMEVVGVVADVRHDALDEAPAEEMYLPYAQAPLETMTLVVGAGGDLSPLAAALRDQVRALDPDLPLADVRPMEQVVALSLAPRRAATTLVGAFAVIAMLLAAVGLYGLVSYSVAQRTRELGVRMALGARAADIQRLVLGDGFRLVAVGLGAGLVAAFPAARLMRGLLFGVGAADPWTYVAVALLVAAVAALASALPARRATRVDPMVALRSE